MVTAERAAKVERAQALRAERMSVNDIAALMGISRSYASDLLCDPDRSRNLERRAGYGGKCVDCGGPTSGSEGRSKAPIRCHEHALEYQRSQRYWTVDRIIEAVQTWAERHDGMPPKADEWICATQDDDGFRYPPRSAVYQSQAGRNNPFDKWADAIEAAGFPRPRTGIYKRKGGRNDG